MPFYSQELGNGIKLPEPGKYATGILFMDTQKTAECEAAFAEVVEKFGLEVTMSVMLR